MFACLGVAVPCNAQFDWGKGLSAIVKGAQAITLTDADMANYVSEYISGMDAKNHVSAPNSKYTVRLKQLTSGLTNANGVPLNFKVYEVSDVNAFACPDGSVRVFSALMDVMSDDELLGVIGHEIGHVALRHSKNAFKHALLTSALRDAVGSTSSTVRAFTDSELGDLAETLSSSKFSQKQENQADDFGYEFLKGAGKNPWAMALSFEKLKSLQGGSANTNFVNQLFSSHPDLNSRIKRMKQRAQKERIPMPTK